MEDNKMINNEYFSFIYKIINTFKIKDVISFREDFAKILKLGIDIESEDCLKRRAKSIQDVLKKYSTLTDEEMKQLSIKSFSSVLEKISEGDKNV